MSAISKIYWRNIKNGNRTFDSIPANVKDDVKTLAREDVEAGAITAEEYKEYIGEDYEG
jgi:hypothetical protein